MAASTTGAAADRGVRERAAAFLEVARPRVLYGLRMAGSITLAMWVAFWMQLEHAYWAPLTAAIMCQPTIGASLRKGQFRIIGTCVGALVIVLLTSAMPQSRIGLLAGLTIWTMVAGIGATLLRNSAAYAASLAGYTAVIVFTDSVNLTPQDTFILAITRATEISIGVVSAGLVLAATDTGDARRRLAGKFEEITASIAGNLGQAFSSPGEDVRERRHELIGKLAGLDPLIDEALGESADLRHHSPTLFLGAEGLLRSLSAWRAMSDQIDLRTQEMRQEDGLAAPADLGRLQGLDWTSRPLQARQVCNQLAREAIGHTAGSVSDCLIADRLADSLLGLARSANAVALLTAPGDVKDEHLRATGIHIPDILPAVVNGLRVGLAVAVSAIVWIELAWPGGQGCVVFTAVLTILFAPQAANAVTIVKQFGLGVALAAMLAAVVEFAVLPGQQSFVMLNLIIAAVIVPAAAFAAGTWHKFFFTAITFIFLALLAPANQPTYDVAGYLNSSLGILVGIVIGLCAFLLLPPISQAWRVRRLLALMLRDVRAFAAGRRFRDQRSWLGLSAARVGSLQQDATPLDRARLVAGFAAGRTVLWLSREQRLVAGAGMLRDALGRLAQGDVGGAVAWLDRLDQAQTPGPAGFRVRAEILMLRDVLTRHQDYFEDRYEIRAT